LDSGNGSPRQVMPAASFPETSRARSSRSAAVMQCTLSGLQSRLKHAAQYRPPRFGLPHSGHSLGNVFIIIRLCWLVSQFFRKPNIDLHNSFRHYGKDCKYRCSRTNIDHDEDRVLVRHHWHTSNISHLSCGGFFLL